jgi:LytS/YehU family sensor histidine kinase
VDPELSEKFIIHLSRAYRYILEQKELDLVSLDEELNFLEAYFFLLQIRFDKKIRLESDLPATARGYKLPPLTLQLLVENTMQFREKDGESTGIGLENIRKRYSMVTDKKIAVTTNDKTFTVQIPLLKS